MLFIGFFLLFVCRFLFLIQFSFNFLKNSLFHTVMLNFFLSCSSGHSLEFLIIFWIFSVSSLKWMVRSLLKRVKWRLSGAYTCIYFIILHHTTTRLRRFLSSSPEVTKILLVFGFRIYRNFLYFGIHLFFYLFLESQLRLFLSDYFSSFFKHFLIFLFFILGRFIKRVEGVLVCFAWSCWYGGSYLVLALAEFFEVREVSVMLLRIALVKHFYHKFWEHWDVAKQDRSMFYYSYLFFISIYDHTFNRCILARFQYLVTKLITWDHICVIGKKWTIWTLFQ